MTERIVPVILAGGSGSRLWPVSRDSFPKQFCKFFGELSLLQETVKRAYALSNVSDLIIIANDNYYFLCKDQMDSIGVGHVHYILEPCPRNTAPAIALSAAYARDHIDPEAVLLVLPSDHYLEDHLNFKETAEKAAAYATQNKLIVFGIKPEAPKTGYGYIEKGVSLDQFAFQVNRFVEKPSLEMAEEYLSQDSYYWNSGMFMFKANTYLNELQQLASDIYEKSIMAYQTTKQQGEFFRINKSFSDCPNISIDYAMMEKTNHAVMLPFATGWNDLGCWASLAESGERDENGNVCFGNVITRDTKDSIIHSNKIRIIAIGVTDYIIVSTEDAILVANKTHSQDVKKVVEQMKIDKDLIATEHKWTYQAWGCYERLTSGVNYEMKRLIINPGQSLLLQLPDHCYQYLLIMSGEADVVNDDQTLHLRPTESICLEKGRKHQLRNLGPDPLSVIAVQSGGSMEKDDIIHDSVGARPKLKQAL